MLELDSISEEAFIATVDGSRKAHVIRRDSLSKPPVVGDGVAICLRRSFIPQRAFARVTYVEMVGDLLILSLDVRMSTGSLQKASP